MPHTFVRIGDGGKGGLGVMMMFSAVKQIERYDGDDDVYFDGEK